MSARITILWSVPPGYQPGDYARLYGNNGSGDIDYDSPLTNNKFDLFPQRGGLLGWYHMPWYHFPWYYGQASRCSGWYHLPWYHFPWYYGAALLKHEMLVDFCGDYKFAFKVFDKCGNENTGTPEEVEISVHIAPPAPTGLKKGTYLEQVIVEGSSTPDVSGTYIANGLYNGYMSYVRTDGQYYIWRRQLPPPFNSVDYFIGASITGLRYFTHDDTLEGEYQPLEGFSGQPSVSLTPKVLTLEAA